MLKLDDNKTEFTPVTSKSTKHLNKVITSTSVGNAQIQFKLFVMNLGFTLNSFFDEWTRLQ